jgi:Amt family ammonium transporter
MTSLPALPPQETAFTLCIVSILLVPFAAAGLALINTGLGRARSAGHSMMASLCVMAIAALAYFVFGFAWQGFPGLPSHVITVGGKPWDWIAAQPFFLRGINPDSSTLPLAVWLQMFSVGIAALIPLGAGGDRWRLSAICISTAIFAGWTYPLFAHWVWGGGWLAQLGVNHGLGHGFLDAGGSSTIQIVGGLTALSIAWILGPRRGKYSSNGMPSAIPGHNVVYVLFGCMLALLGWLGLNCAGALLFNAVPAIHMAWIAINTILAAAAAGLTAAVITRIRFTKPDASLTANGWIGGLVASSAACAWLRPAEMVIVGMVAGALVTFSVEWLEFGMRVDDPGGAVSVHAMAGIWGVLALGLFAHFPDQQPNQWLAQVIGITTLLGFVLPMTYGLNWLLDRLRPQRVARDGERQGMDLHELGAEAYPEFITHTEEYLPH